MVKMDKYKKGILYHNTGCSRGRIGMTNKFLVDFKSTHQTTHR